MDVFDSSGKSIYDNSPRRRKRYILLLYSSERIEPGRLKLFESVVSTAIKDFILIRFEDPDEALKALLVKNIEIIFIDSSFLDSDIVSIDFAVECKKKKKSPILFVPLEPSVLIREYREKLKDYEEYDDYLNIPIDETDLTKKLKKVSSKNARAAKRYQLDIHVSMMRLNTDSIYQVNLNDISLVGFGVTISGDDVFKVGEQVQLKFPLYKYEIYDDNNGDYLKFSGKLRRISIDGKTLGFSIEFLTNNQAEILMTLIEKLSSSLRNVPLNIKRPKELPPSSSSG